MNYTPETLSGLVSGAVVGYLLSSGYSGYNDGGD